MKWDARELDWASGVFEGEGSFSLRRQRGGPRTQALARLNMTDEDVVRRFGRAVGVGRVYGPVQPRNPRHKPYWYWTTGSFQGVNAVVGLLWRGLGARRRGQATEVLQGFRATARPQPIRRRDERKRYRP